jgi:hypothetical protein
MQHRRRPDVAELLGLSAWLHTQATVPWLSLSAAPVDLRGQAVMLARQVAQECDTAAPIGLVAAAGARVALGKGAFDVAQAGLDAVIMPTNTPETMQLAGFLAMRRSVVAAADRRRSDMDAPLEYATELAARTERAMPTAWASDQSTSTCTACPAYWRSGTTNGLSVSPRA